MTDKIDPECLVYSKLVLYSRNFGAVSYRRPIPRSLEIVVPGVAKAMPGKQDDGLKDRFLAFARNDRLKAGFPIQALILKMVSCERYWIHAFCVMGRRPIPRSLEIVGNDTRSVVLDVARSEVHSPEVRRAVTAMRCYFGFMHAWRAGFPIKAFGNDKY